MNQQLAGQLAEFKRQQQEENKKSQEDDNDNDNDNDEDDTHAADGGLKGNSANL